MNGAKKRISRHSLPAAFAADFGWYHCWVKKTWDDEGLVCKCLNLKAREHSSERGHFSGDGLIQAKSEDLEVL